jgi:pimeloyl-ACP methyl ester carboxylesterase
VLLVGHSFGATTALTYSALFPDEVVGCVAVAAFGIGPDTGTVEADTAEADYERALARHAAADDCLVQPTLPLLWRQVSRR